MSSDLSSPALPARLHIESLWVEISLYQYLSLPQFLSFFLDPLSSIKLTFFLFAGFGF